MDKKLRYSQQREQIYKYLTESRDHPSAEMIYNHLRTEMPNISLGTVYRNLKLLEELGMIRKLTSAGGIDRYDAICTDHFHFLCERCGLLRDMEVQDSNELINRIKLDDGFVLNKLNLTLSGLCPNCADA